MVLGEPPLWKRVGISESERETIYKQIDGVDREDGGDAPSLRRGGREAKLLSSPLAPYINLPELLEEHFPSFPGFIDFKERRERLISTSPATDCQ
jgi:hypothetical protein